MAACLAFISYYPLDLTKDIRGPIQSVTGMQAEAKGKMFRPTNVPSGQSFPLPVVPVTCFAAQCHSHTSANSFQTSSCKTGTERLSLNPHCWVPSSVRGCSGVWSGHL